MGAMGMNARKKKKRRAHADTRKKAREAQAEMTSNTPERGRKK